MHVVRRDGASPYEALYHHGVSAARLQGKGVSPTEKFWVGLSEFAPGGGADRGSSPTEKVYIVLEGEITVSTDAQEVTLGPLDSCLILPDETRVVENRSATVARMLVISPS